MGECFGDWPGEGVEGGGACCREVAGDAGEDCGLQVSGVLRVLGFLLVEIAVEPCVAGQERAVDGDLREERTGQGRANGSGFAFRNRNYEKRNLTPFSASDPIFCLHFLPFWLLFQLVRIPYYVRGRFL